jgi:hypothetical protein
MSRQKDGENQQPFFLFIGEGDERFTERWQNHAEQLLLQQHESAWPCNMDPWASIYFCY